jgi:tryptophan-rich sensory protein
MTATSFFRLIASLALCLGIATLSARVTYPQIPTWYASLLKPWWTPPNWAFPLVWTVLYVMMAVSLWLLWDRAADTAGRRSALTFFFLQLVLNAAWSPVFFGLHRPAAALAIIVLLVATIAATILAAWHTQRMAAWLLVPYLAWVLYATSLNLGIVALNSP